MRKLFLFTIIYLFIFSNYGYSISEEYIKKHYISEIDCKKNLNEKIEKLRIIKDYLDRNPLLKKKYHRVLADKKIKLLYKKAVESKKLALNIKSGEAFFRKSKWGQNPDTVIKNEVAEFVDKVGNTYFFSDKISNYLLGVSYGFNRNKLTYGSYMLRTQHTNKNKYIEDYLGLVDLLKKKYGPPSISRIIWNNDLYKNEKKNYGLAVSIGHLVYMSRWNFENTRIHSELNGDNYEIRAIIHFSSLQLMREYIKDDEKNELDRF